jgi:hypothetical protein
MVDLPFDTVGIANPNLSWLAWQQFVSSSSRTASPALFTRSSGTRSSSRVSTDPSAFQGTADERLAQTIEVRDEIKEKVRRWLLEEADRPAFGRETKRDGAGQAS